MILLRVLLLLCIALLVSTLTDRAIQLPTPIQGYNPTKRKTLPPAEKHFFTHNYKLYVPLAILVSFSRILKNCYDVCGIVKVVLFTLILYRCKVIEYAKRSL